MNNRGFAITGIIYTLFILFLMILLSVLSGLSSSQRMRIHSVESLETDLEEVTILGDDSSEFSEISAINESGIVPYFGKYIFVPLGTNVECVAYLDRGTNFKSNFIILSPQACNEYNTEIELKKIYRFEGWN